MLCSIYCILRSKCSYTMYFIHAKFTVICVFTMHTYFIRIVFFLVMQAGFGFLECGAVRAKNATNILLKNILDSCKPILFLLIWYRLWLGRFKSSNCTCLDLKYNLLLLVLWKYACPISINDVNDAIAEIYNAI